MTTRIMLFITSRRKSFILGLVVWQALQLLALAMPSLLLDSGRAKCVTVAAPKQTRLKIEYDAPDWDAPPHGGHKEGVDLKKTTLTITSRAPHSLMDFASSAAGFVSSLKEARDDLNKLKNRLAHHAVAEEIKADKGSIPYELKEDGVVLICLRAPNASAKRPMRFGLSVQKDSLSVMEEERKLNEQKKQDEKMTAEALAADLHLTRMEAEMKRLTAHMKYILGTADFAKERDTLLHQQTISMHSASRFWPIVQVCVLVMTSFTQVSHIVRFFKSRRLI